MRVVLSLLARFLFLVSLFIPFSDAAASERLCHSMQFSCLISAGLTANFGRVSVSYQPDSTSPQSTNAPFDPLIGVWMQPAASEPLILEIHASEERDRYNGSIGRLSLNTFELEPVWNGVFAVTDGREPALSSFRPYFERGEKERIARVESSNNGIADELFGLSVNTDGGWWNELSISAPVEPDSQYFSDTLNASGIEHEWDGDNLILNGKVEKVRFLEAFYTDDTGYLRSSNGVRFRRVLPLNPIYNVVEFNGVGSLENGGRDEYDLVQFLELMKSTEGIDTRNFFASQYVPSVTPSAIENCVGNIFLKAVRETGVRDAVEELVSAVRKPGQKEALDEYSLRAASAIIASNSEYMVRLSYDPCGQSQVMSDAEKDSYLEALTEITEMLHAAFTIDNSSKVTLNTALRAIIELQSGTPYSGAKAEFSFVGKNYLRYVVEPEFEMCHITFSELNSHRRFMGRDRYCDGTVEQVFGGDIDDKNLKSIFGALSDYERWTPEKIAALPGQLGLASTASMSEILAHYVGVRKETIGKSFAYKNTPNGEVFSIVKSFDEESDDIDVFEGEGSLYCYVQRVFRSDKSKEKSQDKAGIRPSLAINITYDGCDTEPTRLIINGNIASENPIKTHKELVNGAAGLSLFSIFLFTEFNDLLKQHDIQQDLHIRRPPPASLRQQISVHKCSSSQSIQSWLGNIMTTNVKRHSWTPITSLGSVYDSPAHKGWRSSVDCIR